MFESDKIDKELFIHKFLTHAMSSDEQLKFENWLEQSEENRIMFRQLSEIWHTSKNVLSDVQFDADQAFAKQLQKIKETAVTAVPQEIKTTPPGFRIFKLNKTFLRVAATIIVLISVIFLIQNKSEYQTFSTTDVAKRFILPDATEVWLNTNSTLKVYSFDGDERKTEISGIVFFDVTHDPSKPFSVKANGIDIKVLGTSFLVDENIKEVMVRKGKVMVSQSNKQVLLSDGQKAKLNNSDTIIIDTGYFKKQLLWINEAFIFDNVQLDKVIRDIEIKYNISIQYKESQDLSQCGFTSGSLKDSSLEEIFSLLKLTYDMEIKKQSEEEYFFSAITCK